MSMNITKIGHCCLLIKLPGVTILTDPGSFTTAQNSLTGIDVILITHEHGDHMHVESLKEIVKMNPNALVITNTAVGAILNTEGILHLILEDRSEATVAGDTNIQAYDGKHEEVFEELGQVQNTGYLIGGEIFYPGDSFIVPDRQVEVLALPVAGPWCRIADALHYAIKVNPKKAFPVHDGLLKPQIAASVQGMAKKILADKGIEFVPMGDGDQSDF